MRHSRRSHGIWPIWAIILLITAPLLVVLTAPLHTPARHWSHALDHTLPDQLQGSLLLMAGTVFLALIIGSASAWAVSAYRFPGRRCLSLALILPIGAPTYISAFNYSALLGPTGTWSTWVRAHFGIDLDIMHIPGLCFVMAVVLYPYVYLPVRAVFSMGLGEMVEASRTLGGGPWTTFRRVALPLARPAMAGGGLLVAMEVLNDYGAVQHFGVQTLTTGIFRNWFSMNDLGTALRIGTLLMGLVIVLLVIERWQRKGKRSSFMRKPMRERLVAGPGGVLLTLLCSIPVILGAVIPLTRMLADAWATSASVQFDALVITTMNTIVLALSAALVTLCVALLFVYARRYLVRGALRWSMRAASLGYVIPGAVIAVGVMTLAGIWDRNLDLGIVLIGSWGLLVFALVVRFLAVGKDPMMAGAKSIPKELDEAAFTLGAGPAKTFRKVMLPLLRPGILAASMLVLVEVVKELPLTLILRPFNFDTLATKAFEMASIEQLREASFASLLIVLIGMMPVIVLERLVWKRR